jgi:hypothetical protein
MATSRAGSVNVRADVRRVLVYRMGSLTVIALPAAAMGTPCVAIFAARNLPHVWFPQAMTIA